MHDNKLPFVLKTLRGSNSTISNRLTIPDLEEVFVGETGDLRAPNDRVDEHILGASLRDLAAEEGWVATSSVA